MQPLHDVLVTGFNLLGSLPSLGSGPAGSLPTLGASPASSLSALPAIHSGQAGPARLRFVPIEVSYLDNQLARAAYAADEGLALSLRLSDMKPFPDVLEQMMDPELRARLAATCRDARRPNGAAEAAALISELVC